MSKSSYGSIYTMFEYINTHILSDNKLKKMIGGDPNDTEPYNTFHTVLDNAYDYLNYVFKNRDEHRQEYENSIANLNEKCDCSQYKCNPETPIVSNAEEEEKPEEEEEKPEEELEEELEEEKPEEEKPEEEEEEPEEEKPEEEEEKPDEEEEEEKPEEEEEEEPEEEEEKPEEEEEKPEEEEEEEDEEKPEEEPDIFVRQDPNTLRRKINYIE